MRKYRLSIAGRRYEVEIEDIRSSPLVIRVDGTPFEVDWEPGSPGNVMQPVSQREAGATLSSGSSSASQSVSEEKVFVAPMPGIIQEIQVKAGDRVNVGQVLCVLEAMKMKNQIRSARAGIIAGILVSDGETVAYGHPLFEFE